MKELELNLENLLLIGLTPEILKNNFEEWIIENKDIQIDFEKKIIYTGILNFRKELNSFMEIANKELLSEWKNPEELDAFLKSQKEMVKANYKKTMDVFPDDESRQDFLLHILPKIHNQFLENKTKYFDNKFADLINDKELVEKMTNKFQELNEIKEGTMDNNSFSVIDNNASATETYCENLINDPLFNPENEYMTLKETFIEDIHSRTAHLKDPYDFFIQEFDGDLQDWENEQKEKIKKTFLKLVKELNHKKIFFFGCSFDNYKHNYEKRLNEFLEYYTDVSENDFIEDELKFLENILYDIQNSEAAHDGHSNSGYDSFSKAYEFVSVTGYKQYFFSHNKKEAFLNNKRFEAIQEEKLKDISPSDNSIVKAEQEKPKRFEIKSKLLKKQLKFLNRNEEAEKYRKVIFGIEKKEVDEVEVDTTQNNLLKSTIEDYLEEFKPDINGDGYEILINALFEYFTNGKFPVLEGKIKFKKINKKRVGWALKELYKSEKTDNLEIEYFRFAQENINLFEKEVIVMENFNKSNFYKTFTSNPAK